MANSSDPISRPGVSPEMLLRAGVRRVTAEEAGGLVGLAEPGIYIPYSLPDGSPVCDGHQPYGRLRLSNPPAGRGKYHQRAGSKVHAFCPPGLARFSPGGDLILIEGEMKSLAAAEAGFAAVGISGFFGFGLGGDSNELCWEFVEALALLKPARVLFVGDSDTALNEMFPLAATRLRDWFPALPVLLPRIPLSGPKGLDDVRAALGDAFPDWWRARVAEAVPAAGSSAGQLCVTLWERERGFLASMSAGAERNHAEKKTIRMLAAMRGEPVSQGRLYDLASETFGVGKRELRKAVEIEEKEQSARAKAELLKSRGSTEKDPAAGIYFDGVNYFRPEVDGEYGRLSRIDVGLGLRIAGVSDSRPKGSPVSPLDEAIHRIQTERRVDYSGRLCGRSPGHYTDNGLRILVTSGPRIIEPREGDPTVVFDFFANLLGRGRDKQNWHIQMQTFMGWLQRGRKAIRRPTERIPGQMLGFVGEADAGKTLAQTLVTRCLGGREADGSLWMTNKSNFNSGLWQAEHIVLSDANLGNDFEARKNLRDRVKEMTSNASYVLHEKGRPDLTLSPIWRITLSANCDPDSALILPPLDPSVVDKVILFRVYPPPKPFHDGSEQGSLAFFQGLIEGLPAFLHQVDNFEVPLDLGKGRFGVKEYCHPEVLKLLQGMTPDAEISEILDTYISNESASVLHFTTGELLAALDKATGGGVRRTTKSANQLGHQLGRLAKSPGWLGRIERRSIRRGPNRAEVTCWSISNPKAEGGGMRTDVSADLNKEMEEICV